MSQFVYTCEPGWEDRLIEELRRVVPESRSSRLASGWIASDTSSDEDPATPCISLCEQCLPRAEAISAKSISEWALAAAARIIAGLAEHEGPWRLHVFCTDQPNGSVGGKRCQLIRESIDAILRKKQRRLLRTLASEDGPWRPDEAVAQVALLTATSGYISVCDCPTRVRYRRLIAPFCGGSADIPADREAPSRAFAKLIEAEIRLGRRIESGQTCVDLGSSPGSWAYVALHRRARVVAVDRSPLRDDLMSNSSLEFVRGDAFKFEPAEPVDWLLCDVVAPPEPIIELLQAWIARRLCQRFCVTIKFHGTGDYAVLEPLKAWLAAEGVEFVMRRLTNNKNEVTVAGELAAAN